jgi:hypothetical protein
METNFKKVTSLILKDENGENVTVINCLKGKAYQITNKIVRAIKEVYKASDVTFSDSTTLTEDSEPFTFAVTLYDSDGLTGEDYRDFTLEIIKSNPSILPDPMDILDPYAGKLNIKRIYAYKKLAKDYNIDESTVRQIFDAGIDWYRNQL